MKELTSSSHHLGQGSILQPYSSASEAVLSKLQEAGLGPSDLMANWRVILWSVKPKDRELKMKLHPLGLVDETGLRQALQTALKSDVKLYLKFKPLSKCCQSACEGCLSGNSIKKAEWIDSVLAGQALKPE